MNKHDPSITSEASQEAVKYDGEKAEYHLIPLEVLPPVGRVLEYGAQKYGAHNWRKGMKVVSVV